MDYIFYELHEYNINCTFHPQRRTIFHFRAPALIEFLQFGSCPRDTTADQSRMESAPAASTVRGVEARRRLKIEFVPPNLKRASRSRGLDAEAQLS